jgi:hypothetical protein
MIDHPDLQAGRAGKVDVRTEDWSEKPDWSLNMVGPLACHDWRGSLWSRTRPCRRGPKHRRTKMNCPDDMARVRMELRAGWLNSVQNGYSFLAMMARWIGSEKKIMMMRLIKQGSEQLAI